MAPLPQASLRTVATLLAFAVATLFALLAISAEKRNLDSAYVNTTGKLVAAQARMAGLLVGNELAQVATDLQSMRSAIDQFRPPPPERIQQWLETIQQSKDEYAWMGLTDAQGKVVVGTRGFKLDADESTSAWFKGGRRGLYFGVLREAHQLKALLPPLPRGEPWHLIDVALPITIGHEGPPGVLVIHLSWPWLRQLMMGVDTAFPSGAQSWLVGPDDQPWFGGEAGATEPIALDSVQRARRGESGWLVEQWPDGHPYIVGFAPGAVPHQPQDPQWMVLVRRRADVWPSEIQDQFVVVLGVAGFVVVLLTAAVWFACTLWLDPLRQFADRVARMHDGQQLPHLPAHLPQEFSWLNQAIVRLVERLNEKDATVQRALRDVQYSFRAVGSSIPGVLATLRINAAGKLQFTYVSETCERYFGIAPQALDGNPRAWAAHAHPEDAAALVAAAKQLLTGGERAVTHPVRFRGGDGVERTLQVTLIQRDGQDGRVFDSISLDITEMIEARGDAERANRAKSDFLATMSHELRTPLNAILGLARALEEGAVDPERKRQARFLRESGETLTRILNDVLDIAKIESGKFDLDPRRFSMEEVIESCASMFRKVGEEKGVGFELELPAAIPPLVGDPIRLRQILHNLLSNAFKFTASGLVALRVRVTDIDVRPDGKREAQVWIIVSDTGVGMSPEELKRVFGRFEQAHRAVATRYGGTGLGLAIVKWLVEKMGGAIEVDSRRGQGTEFAMLIPFEIAPEQESSPAELTAADKEPPLTILLADDYEINRHVLRALLGQRGHEVLEAEDGVQAMEVVAQRHPDLVLMDLDMPNLDGFEATRRIRAQEAGGRATPIYALTGKAFIEDVERASAAGMDGHLAKPVQLDELVAILKAVARRRDRAATTAA